MKAKHLFALLVALMITSGVTAGLSKEDIMVPKLSFAKKDLPDLLQ